MVYKYTDKDIKKAMAKAVLLLDTREKNNKNIILWLNENKIEYKIQKLKYGDYSIMLPKNTLDGITKDLYFDRTIVIEKKASIDEMAQNISKKDMTRFKNELCHLNKYNIKYYIFIQDHNFDKNIRNGNYISKYNAKTLYANIKNLEAQYNTIIRPVSVDCMASEIYNTLYYHARNYLIRKMEVFDNE